MQSCPVLYDYILGLLILEKAIQEIRNTISFYYLNTRGSREMQSISFTLMRTLRITGVTYFLAFLLRHIAIQNLSN